MDIAKLKEKKDTAMTNFKKIKTELGYIEGEISAESKYEGMKVVENFLYNTSNMDEVETIKERHHSLIKIKDDLYVVKYEEFNNNATNINCYYVYEYFSKKINNWDYSSFRETEEMEHFITQEKNDKYTCKECGKKLYWFDNEGDIRNIVNYLKCNICSECVEKTKLYSMIFKRF